MNREENKKRKIRYDKKKAIAPFIADKERIWIHRIARYTNLPEGEIGLRLIRTAVQNEQCIEFFAAYFRRPYQFTESVVFPGRTQANDIEEYIKMDENQERGRFKIKASQDFYNELCEFQIALGTPYLAHATYALLKYALVDIEIIQEVAPAIDMNHIYGPIKSAALLNFSPVSSKAFSVFKNRRD